MRTLVGALTIAGMLLFSGCGGGDPIPTLPPTPSATPIFASEEEALAAAEEAYAAYSEMSDAISSEGGAEPERIAPFVTEDQLEREVETAEYFSSRSLRAVGSPTVTYFQLQQFSESVNGAEIVVYVCLDVSETRVVDATGTDVTPPNRESIVPLEVEFEGEAADALLVSRSEVWSGSSFC